jgi:alpha-L-rhamnosidase
LQWGIVPDELRGKVSENLAKRVEADDKHPDVGILGCRALLPALSENGYADLAYTVVSQETYPSWGYWIVKDNATTLYEQWTAIGEQKEASLNHIMFGTISTWFYETLGGIQSDPAHPGFKHILLKPDFVEGLSYADVSFQSPYGTIISLWERKKKEVTYHLTIPANTTADFHLPKAYKLIKASLSDGKPVSFSSADDRIFSLPAGSYLMKIKKQ